MKQADKWFSIYIRLRDSDENGIIRCCSCGKPVFWKKSDAGHFVNRKHMSLRYSEINVHAQCRECNRFDEGNLPGYSLFITQKYGDDAIKKLLAAKQLTNKMGKFEFKAVAEFYKSKAKEQSKLKRIQI